MNNAIRNIEYNITLLTEEMNAGKPKHRKAYERDIKKLKSFVDKIKEAEAKVKQLEEEAEKYWNNIC